MMASGQRDTFDREMLLAYAAGELNAQDAGAIEAFLARDEKARELVALYRSVQSAAAGDASIAPPEKTIRAAKAIFDPEALRRRAAPRQHRPTWIDSLRQIAATLVFDSRLQPALAGYRGGSSGFELGFASEAGEIDLQAEPASGDRRETAQDAARWRIIGQVSPSELLDDATMPTVAVALVMRDPAERDSSDALTTAADEHGVFTMQADPGRYDLHVRIGETVVVIQDVRIE